MASQPSSIVIIGAGVIGVSTAYYLSQHPSFDPSKTSITVLENCSVAAGASGKAGGLLALDWHSAATTPLAALSYKLHADLAAQHDGAANWGYRRLNTLSAQTNSRKKESNRRRSNFATGDIDWLDHDVVERTSVLGTTETTAQVHPRKFCRELLRIAEQSGVKLVMGYVYDVADGTVKYTTVEGEQELESDCIVVCAGPWTSRILPAAPVSGTRAHSITIIPTKPVTAHAVFTSMTLKNGRTVTPEFYARSDEIYVCGDGDSEPLPKTANDVKVEVEKCNELFDHARELSTILRNGKIGVQQACYLPVAQTGAGAPLVGEVPGAKGLYIATAHSCWGICLAPGTGKVMSELIFDGRVKSADIKMLNPALAMK